VAQSVALCFDFVLLIQSANLEVSPVLPGEVVAGRYVIENVIGCGGTGVVVAARHLALNKRVALKFLRSESLTERDALLRFVREARATAQLQSEHVARVMDAELINSHLAFIAMEYLKGRDLAQVLKQDGPLAVDDALDYILQACEALAEAHAREIIHRDIKPSNLFLSHLSDGTPCVKVLDFGLSKVRWGNVSVTSENRVFGSPHFMSPEQMRASRDVDPRSDIWSLGAVLFALLAGQYPFQGEFVMEVFAAVLSGDSVDLCKVRPQLSPGLAGVVMRCLAVEPEERFQSVSAFASALFPYASASSKHRVGRVIRVGELARLVLPDIALASDNTLDITPSVAERADSAASSMSTREQVDAALTLTKTEQKAPAVLPQRHQANLIVGAVFLVIAAAWAGWLAANRWSREQPGSNISRPSGDQERGLLR
jgi:serine/threonine-protein kinase